MRNGQVFVFSLASAVAAADDDDQGLNTWKLQGQPGHSMAEDRISSAQRSICVDLRMDEDFLFAGDANKKNETIVFIDFFFDIEAKTSRCR